MSWNPSLQTQMPDSVDPESIDIVIVPRARDIGGFEVRRALPAPKRQMVGPFIFFDQVGPVDFLTGDGIDVRPHPHIGLATVTYLLEGEFRHRDSLGSDQIILPGAVNWMIAGSGVTHSERTSEATRQHPHSLSGIQTWVALPDSAEDSDPGFEHHPEHSLPLLDAQGVHVRLILGSAWGETAPAGTCSEMFYADVTLAPGARIPLPSDHEDRAFYVISGSIDVARQSFQASQMGIFRPGDAIALRAGDQGARLLLLGGETMSGPRYIWWNFVASSREKIAAAREAWAAADWQHGPFSLPPGDAEEFVPLP